MTGLTGKICIVTGAASGIGFSITRAFLAAGAVGVTMVDLTQHALETAYADLSASEHARVLLFPGDVSKEATAAGYTEATIRKWGQVDVSVQCAGIPMSRKPLLEVELDVFDKVMAVNVRGVFMGMKQSIAAMVASPSGGKGCSVIIISSQLGLEGSPGYSAYSASKFAVRGLMSAAAQEYGPLGIRVNAICPGPIQTPLMADYSEEEVIPHIAKTSLGRVGQPEEIAATAVFLASEGGAYFSGSSLKVDGGWSQWC